MQLIDPVKIYIAPTNSRAQMICRLLQTSGIEAFAGEDTSAVAGWWGGTIPGIFDAGVFVSRSDAERAAAIISQQENSEAERSKAEGLDIKSTCEECGKTSDFPEVQRGTVQTCPHCGALIDIGEMELPGDTEEEIENEKEVGYLIKQALLQSHAHAHRSAGVRCRCGSTRAVRG